MKRTLVVSIVMSTCSFLILGGCTSAAATVPPTPAAVTASPVASVFPTASPSPSPTPAPTPPALPLPSGCVNPPPDLATIVTLDPPTRLTCFGGSSLTFTATVSKAISDCGIGPRVEPTWFCLPGVFLDVPNASPDSGLGALDVYWNPTSGLKPASFVAGKTVQITGHFDDPVASTCHATDVPAGQSPERSDQVVLTCRETFVVTVVQ